MQRRSFLRLALGIPLLVAAGGLASPMLRLLKPNMEKFRFFEPTIGDAPRGETVLAATLSEIPEPWDFKYFVFTQKYPQYTPQGFKAASVPGVVIRLPFRIRLPLDWAADVGKQAEIAESDVIAFSRICPHLGCIFNYVSRWQQVTAGYGGFVPPLSRRHPLMACPCHLSIFDPADKQAPGRVLSGPAPRQPRTFLYRIRGEEIIVTAVEPGGIA